MRRRGSTEECMSGLSSCAQRLLVQRKFSSCDSFRSRSGLLEFLLHGCRESRLHASVLHRRDVLSLFARRPLLIGISRDRGRVMQSTQTRRSFLTTINKWGSGNRQIGCGRNLHQPSVQTARNILSGPSGSVETRCAALLASALMIL